MRPAIGKRSTRHYEDEEVEADAASSSTSSSRKRARFGHPDDVSDAAIEYSNQQHEDVSDAAIVYSNQQHEDDVVEEDADILAIQRVHIEPPTQAHQPGSIVKVVLKNFVTYSKVEMFPGPSLNMVIGPNGTGKSTIVCAICLGLGWGPAHLGRAKDVSEFVKHGSQEAVIEIELQGRRGEGNPIIRRKINRQNNSSNFWINNSHSNQKQVVNLARSYSIQIDNLCQFLPQDRVVEFAGLSPVDILHETQRVAAPPEILERHEILKKLSKTHTQLTNLIKIDKETLANLEQRQNALQQDVDRLREREEVFRKIDLLKKAIPFATYQTSRIQSQEAKEAYRRCEAELVDLENEVGPAMEKPKQKKRYLEALSKAVSRGTELVSVKRHQMEKIQNIAIPKIDQRTEDVKLSVTAELQRERTRNDDIKKLREKVSLIQRKLENVPETLDLQYYNNLIAERQREIRELASHVTEKDQRIISLMEKKTEIKSAITQIENELRSLDSVAGQRENMLSRMGPDTMKAWKWYQDNKDQFEGEVFGPPVITCSIKDPKYADAVESLMGLNDKLTLVCEGVADYYKLLASCFGSKKNKTKGLGLADVTIKVYSNSAAPKLKDHGAGPLAKEEMRDLGFDSYALDHLEGPEPVLNMLCHESRVHATPISLKAFSPAQNQRMERTKATNWVAGSTRYTIRRRREYNASTTSVRTFGPAQIFSVQQVDLGLKASLQQRILEEGEKLKGIQMELVEKDKDRKEAKAKHEEAKDAKRTVEVTKGKKQQDLAAYEKLKSSLSPVKDDLKQKMESGAQFQETVLALNNTLDDLKVEKAKACMELADLIRECVELQNEVVGLSISEVEAGSDLELLELRNRDIKVRLDMKKKELGELSKIVERARSKARHEMEICKRSTMDLSAEERELLTKFHSGRTLKEIQDQLESEQVRFDLLHTSNPNAIQQYEERAAKIKNLAAKIAKQEENLAKIKRSIAEVREKWEPEVDRLVEKISSAFSKSFQKIGCAGEVRVRKEEEFEKWAIEILVKFRENENLQILTSQRQSGGERAVSTVFYLMALQSLARSPFRVVDEINQGMDPRNERLVHHRMVNIACREYTSQYFLVTPKLLSDLIYHPRMKIHCINSGNWIEEDSAVDCDKALMALRRMGN